MSDVNDLASYDKTFARDEDPIKDATAAALKRILDPLIELMLDAGLTVQEVNKLLRDRAVRLASRRVTRDIGRESKSRVAIITGLPRSEVTKILNSPDTRITVKPDQHLARRVLAAWFDTPTFLSVNGDPAILSIFGKKRSFESLVKKQGSGIPVRAMLDALMQLGAIEQLPDQKVRAKVRVPVLTGLTSSSIAAVGERGKDLIQTLTHNMKYSTPPYFEATALIEDADLEMAAVAKREVAEQGANFISSAAALFNRTKKHRHSKARRKTSAKCRLGVTVFYFQDEPISDTFIPKTELTSRRKNLRRK